MEILSVSLIGLIDPNNEDPVGLDIKQTNIVCSNNQSVKTRRSSKNEEEIVKPTTQKQANFFNAPGRVPFPAPVGGDVNSEEFFAAGDDYVLFFYNFGLVFRFIAAEAVAHMKHMREVYTAYKEDSGTIGALLASEKRRGESTAALHLLWFKRGLEFYCALLTDLRSNCRLPPHLQQEAAAVAHDTYQRTLANHHNYISKTAAKLVLKALPYRRTLVQQLCCGAADADEAALYDDAGHHIRHLPSAVGIINGVFERLQIDTTCKG